MQQANLLKKALAPFYDEIMIPKTSLYGQHFTTWFVFTPAMGSYLLQLAMNGALIHAQRVMYVTAEGVPIVSNAQVNLLNDKSYNWKVLCVSKFSETAMKAGGIHVDGVVPHAIDEDEPFRCQTQAENLRKHYEKIFPDRVLFAYTGSTVARKKVDLMVPAFRKAVKKCNDKIALISNSHLSPRSAPNIHSPNPQPIRPEDDWCIEENVFGKSPHEYVTALHSACDFFLWSTLCEGFGVPPLEAMSCGKPVVAGRFAPNVEFMTDESTIWYETPEIRYENYGLEQTFEMHYYKESEFVDAIVRAFDIFINYKSQYADMCAKAKEQASKYDYRKVYAIELRRFLA